METSIMHLRYVLYSSTVHARLHFMTWSCQRFATYCTNLQEDHCTSVSVRLNRTHDHDMITMSLSWQVLTYDTRSQRFVFFIFTTSHHDQQRAASCCQQRLVDAEQHDSCLHEQSDERSSLRFTCGHAVSTV